MIIKIIFVTNMNPARNLYSRGLPAHGAEFADDLERLVALHDASTEPGSATWAHG